jgi:ABC-type enterobactin transport system permease subunit
LNTTGSSKFLRVEVEPAAAGATAVDGAVFNPPAGGDIVGSKIGEFTGQSFSAVLVSGKAVMTVPVAAFGGDALTITDTPVAFVRNGTFHSDMTPCTVVAS